MDKTTSNKGPVTFAAIDPWLQQNIVLPTETKGAKFVAWGTNNRYPDYLLDLYRNVPTLRSIISGSADFVAGDDVSSRVPLNGDAPAREVVHDTAVQDFIYGGFAFQVIRDREGRPVRAIPTPVNYLRTDEDNEVFYYSEKWNKGGRDALVYPKFMPNLDWNRLDGPSRERHANSILYVKGERLQAYPAPLYCAAVKACELERGITDYHVNALENSFTGSLVINFNNGVPTDEVKEEIERAFTEKFSGSQNGGRIAFSWNPNRESATTFQSVKVEDFGARYDALSKWARQQIFTAFQAVPALFGLMTETTGFSEQEFQQAFRLYNKTRVLPVQRRITDALELIFGAGVVTITPFSL